MICVVRPYANLPSDGAGNDRYVNLCEELKDRGVDARLVCSSFAHNHKTKRSQEQIAANRRALSFVVELDSIEYGKNTSLRRVIYELIFGARALIWAARNRPQSIVIGEPLFFVGWLFVLYGMASGVTISADVIDLWPEADTRPLSGLGGAAVKMLYAVLKFSRRMRFSLYSKLTFVSRSYASMLHLADRSSVFYWGSNLFPIREVVKMGRGTVTIVYAGSFGDGYDIQTVIEAAELLTTHAKLGFRFVIAGAGVQEPLVRESARRGHVDYRGYVDKDALIDLYTTADIGLLPYKANSMVAMPIKFFDYLNFGIFSISSLSLEVSDVIVSNGIGFSYKAGDPRDLCKRIVEAAEDADMRNRATAVCAQLRDYYSIATQYGGFAEFLAGGAGSSVR